jgi:hypothetical protein
MVMNERIKELESQAWEQVNRTNGLVRTEDFNQKFAELIVQECIGHCEDARFKQTNTVPKEYANRRINMCILTIKEHFGVEE